MTSATVMSMRRFFALVVFFLKGLLVVDLKAVEEMVAGINIAYVSGRIEPAEYVLFSEAAYMSLSVAGVTELRERTKVEFDAGLLSLSEYAAMDSYAVGLQSRIADAALIRALSGVGLPVAAKDRYGRNWGKTEESVVEWLDRINADEVL